MEILCGRCLYELPIFEPNHVLGYLYILHNFLLSRIKKGYLYILHNFLLSKIKKVANVSK